MPHKLRPHALLNFRRKLCAALVAAFALAFVLGPTGDAARAQRRRQQPAASQGANSNTSSQKTARTKRVFVGSGSSSTQGSRQTIKSDDSLNDYSAYRSGDRFYVVLPKAAAGAVSKSAGKGYSDMQVQQRGDDVVLSYKLQPGAKPRVEQKFNRLDVVFDTPEGGQPQPQQPQQQGSAQPPRTTPQNTPPAESRNPGSQPSSQTAGQSSQSSQAAGAGHAAAGHTEQRPAAAQSAPTAGATQQPSLVNPLPGSAPQPLPTADAPAVAAQTPAPTPAAEPQLAQAPAQAPALAPGAAVAPQAPATGTTLGAALLNNWPLTLAVALLLVVGFGLLFMARRTSNAPRPTPEEEELAETTAAPASIDEKRAARLKAESASAAKPVPVPVPVPAAKTKDKNKAVTAPAPFKKDEEPKAEKAEPKAEPPAVVETAVAAETPATEPVVAEVAAEEVAAAPPVKEIAVAESPAEAEVPAAPEAATTGIVPVADLGPEKVHREVSRLLEGEAYDRSVVGSSDAMARQMIAAELLSALAGRNDAKRERAQTAFVGHGYLEEATRDLRGAEAPAERAAAARSLGLAGDRAATPHLVAALEDKAVEVRRASVEALASLRDPAAHAPLESLLEREKKAKTKVNRKVVLHAVEACRAAQAEAAEQTAEQTTVETPSLGVVATTPTEVVEAASPEVETATLLTEPAAESRELAPFAEPTVVEAGPVSEAPAETTVEIAPFVEAPPAVEEVAAARPEAEPVSEAAPVGLEAAEVAHLEAEPAVVEEDERTIEAPAPLAFTEQVAEVAEPPGVEEVTAVEEAPIVAEAPSVEEHSAVEEAPAASRAPVESFVAEPEEAPAAVETKELAPFAEQPEPVAVAEPETLEERLAETHEAVEPEVAAPFAEVPAPVAEVFEPVAEAAAPESEVSESEVEAAAPWQSAAEDEAAAAGEWFEFDMSEVGAGASQTAEAQTTEVEPFAHGFDETAAEPESREIVPVAEGAAGAAAEDVRSIAPFAGEPADESPAGLADERHETGIVARGEAEDEVTTEVAPYVSAAPAASFAEKGIDVFDEFSTVPASIQHRLASRETAERAEAVSELARYDTPDTFHQICAAFDDEAKEVRSAAARALFELRADRADSFTRALRESSPERRHNIGTAISASGLASEAISQLTGESREKTYEAFSLLFLMAKAGEVQPLIRAIEGHPSNEVRLAVVKLLALSGQKEILPAFRRLAVRGSLPTEVRSAVMEAIYQISSGQPTTA